MLFYAFEVTLFEEFRVRCIPPSEPRQDRVPILCVICAEPLFVRFRVSFSPLCSPFPAPLSSLCKFGLRHCYDFLDPMFGPIPGLSDSVLFSALGKLLRVAQHRTFHLASSVDI